MGSFHRGGTFTLSCSHHYNRTLPEAQGGPLTLSAGGLANITPIRRAAGGMAPPAHPLAVSAAPQNRRVSSTAPR